jgi:hypothetical protein
VQNNLNTTQLVQGGRNFLVQMKLKSENDKESLAWIEMTQPNKIFATMATKIKLTQYG